MAAVTADAVKLAVLSGACAAGGSVCGKLSGTDFFSPSSQVLNYATQVAFFGLMLLFNAFVWKFYATALQYCNSSLPPTLISTATNYIISALGGCLLFGEETTLLWWSGTALILIGLALVTTSADPPKTENSKQRRSKSS